MREEERLRMREASGNVNSRNKLIQFLYILMRDHVCLGDVEGIMQEHIMDDEVQYTNGWLANYAKDIANRLGGINEKTN